MTNIIHPFRYLLLIVFQLTCLLAKAQFAGTETDSDSAFVKNLSEIVVSASRTETILLRTPEAISVTGSQSMRDHQLRTSPEALQYAPGVFIQKTNHGGGSPFLRGLTGNQTLLLVDGIRLSNATSRYGPNQYFNTIDVFSLGRIEVLKGSGSVQYGSDAIGGTIQAFSREAVTTEKPEWGAELLSRFGTHGMEQSLHGNLSFSGKKMAFIAGSSLRNFGDPVGGDTTGRQTPGSYKELDIDFKGLIALSSNSKLTFAFQRVFQENVWVYHKVALENYSINKMNPQMRELAYIRLNQKINKGVFRHATITASLQRSEEGRELQKTGSDILRLENDKVNTFSVTADLFTSAGKLWSASSGLDFYNNLVNSTRTDKNLTSLETLAKRGLYPDGATMASLAVFSLHMFDLHAWRITAGARYNTFIIRVDDEITGSTRLSPSALVGSLAIQRIINSVSVLFLSANTGFRAPNIDDLGTLGIVDFRYETPNFDLEPEHSFQYQAGYKFQNPSVKGEIYLYRNELYNLIVRNRVEGDTLEGYPVYMKENVERAYIQGIETNWSYLIHKSWQVSGSLTYTFGRNLTRNEPLRRIPPLFGEIMLEYSTGNFRAGIGWQAAAKQDRLAAGDKSDNRIPNGGTPGWNVFNIDMSYSVKFLRFDLSLLNLLNRDYRYHGSGINGYGRSAFLSASLKL